MVKDTPGWTRKNEAARLSNFDPNDRGQAADHYLDKSAPPDPERYPYRWPPETGDEQEFCQMMKQKLRSEFLNSAIGGGGRLVQLLQRLEERIKINDGDSRRVLGRGLKSGSANEIKTRLNKRLRLSPVPRDKAGRSLDPTGGGRVTSVKWVLEQFQGNRTEGSNPREMVFYYQLEFDVRPPGHLKLDEMTTSGYLKFIGGWHCVWKTYDNSTARLETDNGTASVSQPSTESSEATGSISRAFEFAQRFWRPPPPQNGQAPTKRYQFGENFTSRAFDFLSGVAEPTVANAQHHRRSRARNAVAGLLSEYSQTLESSGPSQGVSSLASAFLLGTKNAFRHAEWAPYGIAPKPPNPVEASVEPSAETPLVEKELPKDDVADLVSIAGTEQSNRREDAPKTHRWRRFLRCKPKVRSDVRSDETSDTESIGKQRHRKLLGKRSSPVDDPRVSLLSDGDSDAEPDHHTEGFSIPPDTAATSYAPEPRSHEPFPASQPIPRTTGPDRPLEAGDKRFPSMTTDDLENRHTANHEILMAMYLLSREEWYAKTDTRNALEREQKAIREEQDRRQTAPRVDWEVRNRVPDLTLSRPSSSMTRPPTTFGFDDPYSMPSTHNGQRRIRRDSVAGEMDSDNSENLAPPLWRRPKTEEQEAEGAGDRERRQWLRSHGREFPASTSTPETSMTAPSTSLQQSTMPPSSSYATRFTTSA